MRGSRFSHLLIACLVVAACQGPSFAGDLQVDATLADRELAVSWSATLPAGAVVELELFHPGAYASAIPSNDPDSFPFDVMRTLIVEGQATPLRFDLSSWPAGEVLVSLTFRPDRGQPPAVTDAVGPKGDRLQGAQRRVDDDNVIYLQDVVRVSLR